MSLLEIQWRPDSRQLRNFGFLCLAVFTFLGASARLRHAVLWLELTPEGARWAAVGFWSAAAAAGGLAAVAPGALRPLFLLLTLIALPIGYVVSHAIMAFVFFGVITTIAVIFRLTGRDALQRKVDKDAFTYWVRRPPPPAPERYFRQF